MRPPTQNVRSRAAATVPAAVPRLAIRWLFAASLFLGSPAAGAAEGRTTLSLNGKWQIEESVSADDMPKAFGHTVVVPGMVNLAEPAFPDVDRFASREYILRFGRQYPGKGQILAPAASLPAVGISLQERNYFWYQTSFTVPTRTAVALLKIGKAQFGTTVWLNGKKVGEHLSCWTAGYFDLTGAIQWHGENHLLVRIGAHPAVLPESLPAGTSSSKHRWTPGIYDSVAVLLCDNPVIESIQIAPRIDSSEVVVQTKVRNHGPAQDFELRQRIRAWKEAAVVAQSSPLAMHLEQGAEKVLTETISLPKARLWSPDDPFLYVLESCTGGDSVQTRFGMREVRFDSATRQAYLNGQPFYMRGGNIELSLYWDDPLCGNRTWDATWVRKLVAEIPKRLHWNAFRFVISVMPELWLDIADEEGMLIQYEPTLWQYHQEWDTNAMIQEYGRWMRDNWNHPCVFMWDSNNETVSPELAKIINAVRGLDLSGRAWDNSWSPPAGPHDPVEVHPYLLRADFDLRQLNNFNGSARLLRAPGGPAAGRCYIINEYCWLWLYSDGAPIDITEGIYQTAVPNGTAQDRQEFRWYVTGALTEMWRAQRCATAVLYYEYLGSYLPRKSPGPYDFGAFSDVASLKLQPEFEDYMTEAFKPLGVYIDFWGDGKPGGLPLRQWAPIQGGAEHPFSMVLINDDREPAAGTLVLGIETREGVSLATRETPFRLAGLGREVYQLALPVPQDHGKYLLKATARPQGTRHKGPTVGRRKLSVEPLPPPLERLKLQPAYAQAVAEAKPAARWALTPADNVGGLGEGVNRPRVDPLPAGTYSVEFWFLNKKPNRERAITAYLLSRGATTVGDHLGIAGTYRQGEMAPGRLFFWNGTKPDQSLCGRTEIASEKWHHVVFVRDGKDVQVYLNGRGEPEIRGQTEPGCTADARQLHLGNRDDGFAELDGQVDHVAVYDRVLTAAEVSAHYAAAAIPAAPAADK